MSQVTVAKIITTPNTERWSQAYHAGGLFAVLSLVKDPESLTEETLNSLGKDIFNTLEEEYFTLETKDFTSIKTAFETTKQKIPQHLIYSFVVAVLPSLSQNTLYVFACEGGKVLLKRGEKLGILISSDDNPHETVSASGNVEPQDTVILTTETFTTVISFETLYSSLQTTDIPSIAERLSSKLQEQENPEAAALLISYHGTNQHAPLTTEQLAGNKEEKDISHLSSSLQNSPDTPSLSENFFILQIKKIKALILHLFSSQLTHTKKVALSILFILVIVFGISIFFSLKKQEDAKTKALFQEVFSQANKKYDEGQSLMGLNKPLATDSLKEAEKIIQDKKKSFKKDSKEAKQFDQLLHKISQSLSAAAEVNSVLATTVPTDKSEVLAYESANSSIHFAAQDDKTVYVVNANTITTIDKKTKKEKAAIKNTNGWKDIGGIGTYLGNIYLLDKSTNQILKYVPSASAFTKSSYFSNNTIDLSTARALTIDGAIWVLLQNGDIKKFTKGKLDTFALTGLDKPLQKPTRIFTNADVNRLYILDNGNSRIVIFNKNGSYQEQYQSSIIKDALDFDVSEKDKKIYILSQDKIYQIDIK